jgi:Protein of unknown function (DUF2924)
MKWQPAKTPAAIDLDAGLAGIAAMNVEQLRELWRQKRGQEPPAALSKDLIARALAYWLQEEVLGGLDARVRKLLGASSSREGPPARHVKVGSVIVREYQAKLHEVLVVPGGFCWQGEVFASLSTIARKITGTSWNGPRFFGLRGGESAPAADAVVPSRAAADTRAVPRSGSIKARPSANHRRDVV